MLWELSLKILNSYINYKMLIDDSNPNDQFFFKNFFGLTLISNKNPLSSFLGFLNDSKNQLPLANLNFNLRFLSIKSSVTIKF